jgi:hypothetical protein
MKERPMRKLVMVLVGMAAVMLAATPSASAAPPIPATGTFDAVVDFSTLQLTPRGQNCLLEVEGELVFEGTLQGTASGTTAALIFATCDEVLANPPGTFRDVFMSKLVFTGQADGVPVEASMTYQGQVSEGGEIRAIIRVSRGLVGVMDVEARVAEGGSYSGFININ